ncbi:MAG: 23S rRNA (uracil(1939)-C(5))-methyltransferase RlmD [Clostridia bacterium]|nr:23S rRNA (uracil(1939)-C(5))-methyltransferase RlmD [Clostridia bacterium]
MDNKKNIPVCKIAKKCSACQLNNMDYERQLNYKQAKAVKLLRRFCRVEDIIGMEYPYYYRNKSQMVFKRISGGKIISGVYKSSTGGITATDDCFLNDKKANEITAYIRALLPSLKITVYDPTTKKGILRHVTVRTSKATGEYMVILVCALDELQNGDMLTQKLTAKFKEISTIVMTVSKSEKMVSGKGERVLFGNGYIEDILLDKRFRISANSFYQVNSIQTAVLYKKAIEYAGLSGKEKILDAYCGTGTIGICASDNAASIVGVELNESAVKDARINAQINNVKNAVYNTGDAALFMSEQAKKRNCFDVVFVDPPRAGCSTVFLKSLCALMPERVVYISCEPQTLARDLYFLTKNGYKVQKIQPIDMFPHTGHIETVVLLSRNRAVHYMQLNPEPYEMIKSGQKTIELRLFDEKRSKINTGDEIVFTNTSNGKTLHVVVSKLHRFDSFDELYDSLPLLKCGYTAETIANASSTDMEQYYSVKEQKKYGVIGIEIFQPNETTSETVCFLRSVKF